MRLRKKESLIGKVILIFLVLAIGFVLIATFMPKLSVYSYAKEVPVQIGYDSVKNYWVLSAIINEETEFKCILHSKTEKMVEENTKYQATSEVGILFTAGTPDSITNLFVTNYKFVKVRGLFGVGYQEEQVPAYDVDDANWLTSAHYKVALYKNGNELVSKDVTVNYKEKHYVNLDTGEGTVRIENLGLLPYGVEVPSGDLVYVYNPTKDKFVLVDKADLVNMINAWNHYIVYETLETIQSHSWGDVWIWAKNNGKEPREITLEHVSEVKVNADKTKITLIYAGMVFSADITIYIPSDLADTVIIKLNNPKPKIVSITPKEISLNEGQKQKVSIMVKNEGTKGSISLSLFSDYFAFEPITSLTREFKEGETYTFEVNAYALNVPRDVSTDIKVLAQGRGGEDEATIKATIKDTGQNIVITIETILKVNVVNEKYERLGGVSVEVTAGSEKYSQTTNNDGVAEFNLKKYTGAIKVKAGSIEKVIDVKPGVNEITIVMTLPINWLLILLAVIGIGIVLFIILILYSKYTTTKRTVRMARKVTKK
jgi:hypothetical protein